MNYHSDSTVVRGYVVSALCDNFMRTWTQQRRLNESSFQIRAPRGFICLKKKKKKKIKKNQCEDSSQCLWAFGCTLHGSTGDCERQRLHSAESGARGHLSNPGCFCLNMHQSTSPTNHSAICRRLEKYCLLEFAVYILQHERQNTGWLFSDWCNCLCSGVFVLRDIIFYFGFLFLFF